MLSLEKRHDHHWALYFFSRRKPLCIGQWSDDPSTVQPGWYLPPQKIPLAENRFLQAGKGAENPKENSRQCALRDHG